MSVLELPGDVRLARGTPADAADVANVSIAADTFDAGEPDYDETEAAADLADPNHEWWLARAGDGRLLGYIWLQIDDGHTGTGVEVTTHPDADDALGPLLLRRAIDRAHERTPDRPLHLFAPGRAGRRRAWVESTGATFVRRFSRMLVDLDAVPTPEPPAGVTMTREPTEEADLRAMHEVLEGAFADHFGSAPSSYDDWLARNRGRAGYDPALWWLARIDEAPAAALVGREMADMGWVQTLGTLAPYRGRGLGTLLLRTAFAAFVDRGQRRVGLGVDTENTTGALRLYSSLGMRPTLQWDTYELPPAEPLIASPANGSTTSASKNA